LQPGVEHHPALAAQDHTIERAVLLRLLEEDAPLGRVAGHQRFSQQGAHPLRHLLEQRLQVGRQQIVLVPIVEIEGRPPQIGPLGDVTHRNLSITLFHEQVHQRREERAAGALNATVDFSCVGHGRIFSSVSGRLSSNRRFCDHAQIQNFKFCSL